MRRMSSNLFFTSCLLTALLPAGCVPDDAEMSTGETDPQSQPGVYLSQDVFECFTKAAKVAYIPDPPGTDTWQTPRETQQRAAGDCEDICIYLQHLLAGRGVHVEVVFGLKDALATNGHAWLEGEFGGRRYIIEPRTIAMVERARLPHVMYIPAENVDVVAEKVRDYHGRTGVYVNTAYGRKLQRKTGE